MTRILIADDHEVVRSGLRLALEAHRNWKVVAEASDGEEAIAKAVETIPDVAIIDFSLPRMNGIEATRQILARVPTTEVLVFSMHESATLKSQALEAGARAYVLKSNAVQHLIAAVTAATSSHPEQYTRDVPSEIEIRATLEAMLVTEAFRTSPQLVAFLRFVVEATLRGERESIKGYTIAVEALGRREDFDPSMDPIVRVEAGRLRRAIKRYYGGPGADDLVAIEIPRGHYVPTFRYRSRTESASSADEWAILKYQHHPGFLAHITYRDLATQKAYFAVESIKPASPTPRPTTRQRGRPRWLGGRLAPRGASAAA